MKEKTDIIIQNIVATTSICRSLDLVSVLIALDEGAVYEPETFPGLVYHLKDPKTASLIFSSGKLVCTGAKSVADVERAIGIVVGRLVKAGFEVDEHPEILVQNIVATSDLKTPINLTKLAIAMGMENIEYEPEVFPGLVYRIMDPKVVALLFCSGKVVCTGAKRDEDLHLAMGKIRTELMAVGML